MLSTFFKKYERWVAAELDDSSKLIPKGRDEYKYIEGDREMLIFVDVMGKEIHEDSIDKWLPPYASEEISAAKKKEILDKVCRFFRSRNIPYAVISKK